MHFTIQRETLIAALSRAAVAAATKATIPVLSCARFQVSDTQASITATDLEQQITETVDVTGHEPGDFLIPVVQVLDIAKRLPKGAEVDIRSSGNTGVTIKSGRYHTTLNVLDPADFPEYSSGEYACTFTVSASVLKSAMQAVQFAVSTEETRYYLCGIHIHTDGDKLKFVATDGHRLALSRIVKPEMTGEMPGGVILPRKAVSDVLKMLDVADTVVVSLSESRARFEFGFCTLETKLIDGSFPDYERVIPRNNQHILTVSSSSLDATTQRVAAVGKEKSRPVKFEMNGETLNLTCQSEGDTATDSLDVTWTGEPMEIGFQARYVSDVLTQVKGNAICAFADNSAPVLISDDANEDVRFVLMPMRV